jgi:hypothetical protein
MANIIDTIYNRGGQTTTMQPPSTTTACCCPACGGLECLDRTRFFAGQLLTEADLNNEQSYWLAKNRLHNRYLHGWGVVCGLQVVCAECDGWVTVKTGYALDPCGNDIIVCEDQPFNVIKAIQACCTPPKATNCSPLRYTPSPTCQDVEQTWCITIEYQEQATRMVTPLRQSTPKSNGCGCGCQENSRSQTPASSPACGCASTQPQTPPSTNGSCEPTRILEGFKLGVVPAPTEMYNEKEPKPGTIDYQKSLCLAALQQALTAKPDPTSSNSDSQAYQAVCNYLTIVKNALGKASVTHCQIESALNLIQVPAPDGSDNYRNTILAGVVDRLVLLINTAAFDCFCTAFIPPCGPEPCDDKLILACVTVRDGKIITICHFGGRRQVVTFPVLYYWLSYFNIDKTFDAIITFLQGMCCGSEEDRRNLFGMEMFTREPVSSAGFSNPATVNRMMSYMLSQKMGANLVNANSPTAQAVDLRPLIGQNLETLQTSVMRKYGIKNITVKDVSSDAAWNDSAVSEAGQFAPAAFSLAQPLTVFVTGEQKQIVGFDVTDPVHVLQNQVAELQARLDSMAQPAKATIAKEVTPAKTLKRKNPN